MSPARRAPMEPIMPPFDRPPKVHHHTDACYGTQGRLICPRPPLSWSSDAYEPGGVFYSEPRRRPPEVDRSGMVIIYVVAAIIVVLIAIAVLRLAGWHP